MTAEEAIVTLKANYPDACYEQLREAVDVAIEALKQPEIIHCKDCKYWIPYDWMFSEVWQSQNMADYPEDEIGCNYCDVAMKANDFCSMAEKRGSEDDETDCDYERAVEQLEHDMLYESTFNPDDGSM